MFQLRHSYSRLVFARESWCLHNGVFFILSFFFVIFNVNRSLLRVFLSLVLKGVVLWVFMSLGSIRCCLKGVYES